MNADNRSRAEILKRMAEVVGKLQKLVDKSPLIGATPPKGHSPDEAKEFSRLQDELDDLIKALKNAPR